MSVREAAQAQARHRLGAMADKVDTVAKSLRDQKMRVSVVGRMGALHAIHGASRLAGEKHHEMFEQLVGLVDDPEDPEDEVAAAAAHKEAIAIAESVYMASLIGDCQTLAPALEPLKPPAPPPAPEEPEPVPAKGGKGDAKKGAKAPPPEPEFEPELEIAEPKPQWRIVDVRGIEPLAHACSRGHAEAARLLIEAGADVEAAARTCGRTALHRAAEAGRLEAVQVLLEHGASATASNKYGGCPLLAAASRGHQEVVAHLLALPLTPVDAEGGEAPAEGEEVPKLCRPDQADHGGLTPLMAAARGGHAQVCEVLIEGGASMVAVDANGWSPLHHACRGRHKEVATLLVRRGCPVARHTKGNRKLHEMDKATAAAAEAEAAAMLEAAEADLDADEERQRPETAPA